MVLRRLDDDNKAAAEPKVPLFAPMAGPPGLRRPLQPMVFPVRVEHREKFRALMAPGKSTALKTIGFVQAGPDGGASACRTSGRSPRNPASRSSCLCH